MFHAKFFNPSYLHVTREMGRTKNNRFYFITFDAQCKQTFRFQFSCYMHPELYVDFNEIRGAINHINICSMILLGTLRIFFMGG